MVLPGHLAGGYLAEKAFLFLTHPALSTTELGWLYAIAVISSEGPDSDLIYFYIARRFFHAQTATHRDYVTHAPILWLGLCLIIAAIGALAGSLFVEYVGLSILVGSWSHFILDSIEYGIQWFWPLSKKRFAMITIDEGVSNDPDVGTFAYYWRFVKNVYLKRVTFYAEVALSIAAIVAILI